MAVVVVHGVGVVPTLHQDFKAAVQAVIVARLVLGLEEGGWGGSAARTLMTMIGGRGCS